MKVSVCITTLNESESIEKLLDSLIHQTKKPTEIIIVDAGSTDGTIEKVRKYKNKVKLIVRKGVSISKGRNISIKNSSNEIIVLTDAGCIAKSDWLKKITTPFKNKKVDVVAGFYHMAGDNSFQKSASKFLGVAPSKFDKKSFLPSARSMAFRKNVWKRVGGFTEKLDRAGEDTYFNFQILNAKFNIRRVKSAIVYWEVPSNIFEISKKFFYYAKGDAQSGILLHDSKGIKSHNIKVLSIFLRYIVGVSLYIFSTQYPPLLQLVLILVFLYVFWAYKKAGLWGIVLQFVSDFCVMSGFISGIMSKYGTHRY